MMRLNQLGIKLALLFLSLFGFLQLVELGMVRQTVVQQRQQSATQQLMTADRIFANLLQQTTLSKQQALQFLVSDLPFRETLISQETAAIRGALLKLKQQTQASVVEFQALDGSTWSSREPTVTRPSSIRNASKQTVLMTRGDTPYQWLSMPVTAAPTRIGDVALGFPLDQALALRAKHLSQVEFSFFKKTGKQPWQLMATTRAPSAQAGLMALIQQYETANATPQSVMISGKEAQTRLKPMSSVGAAQLLVVMQAPIDAGQSSLIALFVNLFSFACFGLALFCLAVWGWTRHTVPLIETVSNALTQMASQGHSPPLLITRQDELGGLAQAFNRMRSAVQQRAQQLETLCLQDPLTGLDNQLGFSQALQAAIDARAPDGDTPGVLTLVLVNLQQFKALNVLMGRPVADEVLRQTGLLLKQTLSSKQDVVGRLDADMFAVLLMDISQPDVAHYVEQIHAIFKQALHIHAQTDLAVTQTYAQPLTVQIRTGIALFPAHGHAAESLLRHALLAVQTAKKQHTHRAIYHETMAIEMAEQLAMVAEIKEAIAQSQLMLYLQPIVDLSTHQVLAAEALLRWAHPEKGMLFPDQFLPMIERTEVIHQLTDWILNQAYALMAALREQGIRLNLSVNLTARDFTNHALPQQLLALRERYQCPSNALTLEVTEQALMHDAERAETMIRQLAMAGIPLSIDQFGSAYSSLTALRRFTMHELKIDKAFITYMHKNPADYAMAKSIIELAHNLGMHVVAEGIESEEVLVQLTQLGCQAGQGFFIAKPMPARDINIWLERWLGEHSIALDIGDDVSLTANPLADMPQAPI